MDFLLLPFKVYYLKCNKKRFLWHDVRSYVGVSVTRLGDFLKFLVTNLLTKVAQIFRSNDGLF